MRLAVFATLAVRHRRIAILLALLSTFAGADLLLNRPKGSELQWFAIPFLAGGAALFAWTVWPRGVTPAEPRPSLASRFLHAVTWRGRVIQYFPLIGIAILVADLAFNATVSATPALLTEDTIVLLGAASLIAYGFVPRRFARERDFVLVFFLALNAILVVPLLVARAYYADFERSVDLYSWVALAPQTSGVLSFLGVTNTLHEVVGSTAPGLTFTPLNLGTGVTVVITTACSGIYSFWIFAAAFTAFILTEYERPAVRTWVLLGLGLFASYVANVLRMVVIVLVGYFTDTAATDLQNMLVAHSYAGWLIFLAWITLFWGLLIKVLPAGKTVAGGARDTSLARHPVACGLCPATLSPAIPATRCGCGRYYHVACLSAEGRCPACGRNDDTVASSALEPTLQTEDLGELSAEALDLDPDEADVREAL